MGAAAGRLARAADLLAVALFAVQMYTAITVPVTTMVQRPLFVAAIGLLTVLYWRGRWPLLDLAVVACFAVPTVHVVLNHADMADRLIADETEKLMAIVLMAAVLETTRRTLGLAIPVLVMVFAGYALLGPYMPELIAHNGVSMLRIASSNFMSASGVYGGFTGLSVAYLFLFIAFASLLASTGGGQTMMDLAQAAAGRYRGGPAKIAVVSSGLFSMISGSAVANVAATGSVTIPMMKRYGYKPHVAGAIESLASSAGNVTPPIMGAAGFMLAQNLGVPYDKVMIFAAVPALLFYIGNLAIVDLEAARNGLKGAAAGNLPRLWPVLRAGWFHFVPLVVLVWLLAGAGASPGKSIFWCIVLTLAAFALDQLRTQSVATVLAMSYRAVAAATKGSLAVVMSLAALGILIELINSTGLGVKLSSTLIAVSGGSTIVLLLLTALTSIVLGMGIPTVACYAILAVLAAPAMVRTGVHPYAAHLFVLYFGVMSSITPPVALGAYVAAGIAGADPTRTGLTAVWFAIPTFLIPFIFAYQPVLLLTGGSVVEMVLACATALIGVACLSAALQAYLFTHARPLERLALAGGAILAMVPGWRTDLAGFALLALAAASNWHRCHAAAADA